MIFDYIISNPPYQRKIGVRKTGQNDYQNIYDKFQMNCGYSSKNTVMIYPAGWQTSSQSSFTKWIIGNGLKQSDFYFSDIIFGDSVITGYPISINYFSLGYNGRLSSNGVQFDRDLGIWVDDKRKEILLDRTRDFNKMNPGVYWISDLNNIEDSGMTFYKSSEEIKDPVSVFIKERPGVGDRCTEYFIERSRIEDKYEEKDINSYTVAIRQQYIIQNRIWVDVNKHPEKSFKAKVFPPNHVFAKTWLKIINFNTKEEAENFAKYFNSLPVTILITVEKGRRVFARQVPLLDDYTNNSVIDWDKNIDEQICKLFGLNNQETHVILEKLD